jgi:hypothetical protein
MKIRTIIFATKGDAFYAIMAYLNIKINVRPNGTMMKRLRWSKVIRKRRVWLFFIPLH